MMPYRSAPQDQLAFILNLANHWFCIRSFGQSGADSLWFNLNSFLPEPSWVGSNYLGALLDQCNTEGYSVFVVRPTSDDTSAGNPLISQFRSSDADQAASVGAANGDDDELQRAIQASMAESSTMLHPHTLQPPQSTSSIGSSAAGPSSSGGRPSERRRKSRRQGEEGIQEAWEAGLRRSNNGVQAGPSGSTSGRASSSRRQAAGTQDDAIELDDDDEDSGVLSTSRSPFLNPTLRDQLLQDIGSDEELNLAHAPGTTTTSAISLPSSPTSEDYDLQDSISAYRAMSSMQDARDYDDEDAELQRALAASLASPHEAGGGGGGGGDDDDIYGDAEEQARIFEQLQRERDRSQRSPTPADVGRIAKMREEARVKEREEKERQERRSRGEFTPEPPSAKVTGEGEEGDEEEEETAPEPVLTQEELRRRRLARFGGA